MSFSMLPDDTATDPDVDLAAAIAGALDVGTPIVPIPDPPAQPLGRSWEFDFGESRQFVRAGGAPADAVGVAALEQWCLMAIYSARYAFPVFSDQFGMEDPEQPIGELGEGEILADYQQHLIEALLVHDRISDVQNVELYWDPVEGTLTILSLDVILDDDTSLTLTDVTTDGGM